MVPFKSVDDIIFYIQEHVHHFGFRPDQIKVTPDMYFKLVQHIDRQMGVPHNARLIQFMGVSIQETENVQDGTKYDVLAKYRQSPELKPQPDYNLSPQEQLLKRCLDRIDRQD